MDIDLYFDKSLEENASSYYGDAKAAKKKLLGLKKAMVDLQKKAESAGHSPEKVSLEKKRKRQWFEAFHWFRTSDGFLVIGGRDARSNEAVVKKHLDDADIYFHADIPGAASCVVKSGGSKISELALEEAALFSAVRSKAWQLNLPSVDVYAVSKEQVSKSAPSGEALGTGAFMIYGKRQWFRKTPLVFSIGLVKESNSFCVMAGPPSAIRKNTLVSFEVVQGRKKRSDVAKAILAGFEEKAGGKLGLLDDILGALPGEKLSIRE